MIDKLTFLITYAVLRVSVVLQGPHAEGCFHVTIICHGVAFQRSKQYNRPICNKMWWLSSPIRWPLLDWSFGHTESSIHNSGFYSLDVSMAFLICCLLQQYQAWLVCDWFLAGWRHDWLKTCMLTGLTKCNVRFPWSCRKKGFRPRRRRLPVFVGNRSLTVLVCFIVALKLTRRLHCNYHEPIKVKRSLFVCRVEWHRFCFRSCKNVQPRFMLYFGTRLLWMKPQRCSSHPGCLIYWCSLWCAQSALFLWFTYFNIKQSFVLKHKKSQPLRATQVGCKNKR